MFNLLIIDDDEMSLESLKEFLSSEGFNIYAFTSPLEALSSCEENHYDLIATDFRLPHMDGIQLIRKVRTYFPDIRTILFTGFYNEMIILKVKNENIDLFLPKPIRIQKFINAVNKLLSEFNFEISKQIDHEKKTKIFKEKEK